MISTKGFIITSKGDSKCGIFEQSWQLDSEYRLEFETQADVNYFKTKLKEAFEVIADDATVELIEDHYEK